MFSRITGSLVVAASLLSANAFAQEAPTSVVAQAKPKNTFGAQLDLLPGGSLQIADHEESTSTAYGLGVTADTELAKGFSVGIAPRVIFNVQGEGAPKSAKEYDLRLRARLHTQMDQGLEGYVFLAPGWSIIDFPDTSETSSGLVVALGGGMTKDISPTMFVGGEVGYQIGSQKHESSGETVEISTSYFHMGFVVGNRF